MNSRSRLSRREEKQSKKNFLLSIFGILVILFFLIKFGVPMLINFTLLLSGSEDTANTTQNSGTFIPPPVLSSLPYATNSAKIKIKGRAAKKQTIKLYINDSFTDKKSTDGKGEFIFEDIELSKGENDIKAKAVDEETNRQSNFSANFSVIFRDKAPNLTIDSPFEGQNFSKDENQINVSGKTDPGVKVTVNDFWAITESSGQFNYSLKLQNGENKIKIAATDEAGNKTEKEIKVNYSN